MSPERVASDRAPAILYSQASGQRVLATEVHHGARELAATHHHTAELLNLLAARAPEIWADAERLAALAANATEAS